jgi:hypothetical protein
MSHLWSSDSPWTGSGWVLVIGLPRQDLCSVATVM